MSAAPGARASVWLAIVATASRAIALFTAAAGARAPDERAVRRDERGGHVRGAQAQPLERLDDDLAGGELVVAGDLVLGQLPRHGDGGTKVIGMGRPERRDRPARLGPARGRRRVGVDDAADLRVAAVEREVRRRVRRRPKVAADDVAALDRHGDELLGSQLRAGHAARLDDEDAGLRIETARVPEREGHEAGPDDRLVRSPDGVAQLVEEGAAIGQMPRARR